MLAWVQAPEVHGRNWQEGLPPTEEDYVLDDKLDEDEMIAALDEDIREMEEEHARLEAVTPEEIKALWHDVERTQANSDRPHIQAQLDRGVLDLDMDEPRTLSYAGVLGCRESFLCPCWWSC